VYYLGARVPTLRGAGCAAARIVSIDDAIGNYVLLFLLDFDETHVCLEQDSSACVVGCEMQMRSRCDSWADQCGVRSGMEREKSGTKEMRCSRRGKRCESPLVTLRRNERQLMVIKNHAERQMLGGCMPSHTWRPPCQLQAAPPWNWSMWELVTTWLAEHGNPC
jgi:hypothetical protein